VARGHGRPRPVRKPLVLLSAISLPVLAVWMLFSCQGSGAADGDATGQVPAFAPTAAPTSEPTPQSTATPTPTHPSTSATPKPKRTASPTTASASTSASSTGPLLPLPGTFYRLQNARSGDCLAQPAGAGTATHEGCTAGRSEGWQFAGPLGGLLGAVTGQSELVNGLSGDCLTAGSGGQVGVRKCTGDPAQQWSKTGGTGAATGLRNAGDGRCLTESQGTVVTGPCGGDQSGLWAEDGTV
jgi:hypothetical protein